MRRKPRRYQRRNTYASRRRRKNWIPFIIFVLVVAFFFWAIFQFFSVLLSNVRTETTAAELSIEKGRAEFQLSSEKSQWTPAFSGQTFVEGDRLKTAKNSRLKLDFLSGSTLFLDQDTEIDIQTLEKTSTDKKTAFLKLSNGNLWGYVDPNLNQNENLDYQIETDRLRLKIKGTIFSLISDENQDVLRLMKGSADAEILDDQNEVIQTLSLGIGQQLTLNEASQVEIANNQDVLTLIDSDFLTSKWHTENLAVFDADEAAKLEAQANGPAETETPNTASQTEDSDTVTLDEANLLDPLEILEPAEGATISADVDLVKIVGTAPAEASQVQVNGYTLSKYQPGDRKWSYFAATKFGTLKNGLNTYTVVAFSRDGRQTKPVTLSLNYEGTLPVATTPAPSPNTEEETNNTEETSNEVITTPATSSIAIPLITSPAIFAEDPTATYETSAAVVTISGTVSNETKAVEVNGFQLRKFAPGDTRFSYIANANYGNMKEGENIFRVVAIGVNGNRSEQQIKIVYTPIEVQ